MVALLVVSIILILLSYMKNHKFFTINNIFTCVWAVPLFLDTIISEKMGILTPSNTVILYVGIAIVVFNIVYLVLVRSSENEMTFILPEYQNKTVANILLLFSLIVLLPATMRNLVYVLQGNFGIIRTLYVQQIKTAGGIYNYIFIILPLCIINCTMIIAAIDVIKKRQYKFFVFTFIVMCMYAIAYGGREQFKTMILYFLILIVKDNKSTGKKQVIPLIILLFISVIIVAITFSRGGSSSNLFNMFCGYFINQFSLFEYILNNPISYGLNLTHTYGLLSLGPIISLPAIFLKFIIGGFELPSDLIGAYTQQYANISVTTQYIGINAHTTSLYYFIFDFGKIGVILGPLIFALIVSISQKKKVRSKNITWSLINLYLIIAVINSPISYDLCQPYVALMIPVMFFMTKKVNIVLRR